MGTAKDRSRQDVNDGGDPRVHPSGQHDHMRRVQHLRDRIVAHPRGGGRLQRRGPRPFGSGRDGVTIRPAEAAEIVQAADALLARVPIRQITADLRRRGVRTVTGATWKPTTGREILRRPRNAGILVYRGEEIGTAPWQPILPEPAYRAVCAALEDPARRTTAGNTPRWLGSGLYRCGTCQKTVSANGVPRGGGGNRRSYRCPYSHVTRAAERLDEDVAAVITARLARPDAADLLTAGVTEPDLPDLRKRAVTLRELLNEQARLHARGVIDGQQLAAGSGELRSELTAVESRLASVIRRDPLDGIAGRPDAAGLWDNLDLGRQRAVLSTLCTVTLGPAIHGRLPGGAYLDASWHLRLPGDALVCERRGG